MPLLTALAEHPEVAWRALTASIYTHGVVVLAQVLPLTRQAESDVGHCNGHDWLESGRGT